MKHKKSQTLMFQLGMCFAAILIALSLLLAFSWKNARQEKLVNEDISAVMTPYTQLYTGMDALGNSFGRGSSHSWNPESMQADMELIESASRSLMEVLNANGFNRASIDLYNTVEEYLAVCQSVITSYNAKDYYNVVVQIERFNQIEQWIRDYLRQCSAAVSQRREALTAESDARRSNYYRQTLVLGSLIFLLCAFTLLFAARRFVAPIQALCQNVKAFRLTDDLEVLQERGLSCQRNILVEIRTLATAIYSMQNSVLDQYSLEKNNVMLRTRLNEEALRTANIQKELQETQLKALQAQINPHFLFNTLNMIAQMSYIEGAERTTDLLETFSDYFRYNVESFERSVTLAEELNNVRGYIALQKERFGDRIAYTVEADDAVLNIQVPCLIIQPLVENAISHGLRMKTENGEVRTSIRAIGDGGFEITVQDNGCGMDEETLQHMIRRVTQTEADADTGHRSIGVANVVRRLKIFFGDNVAFSAQSAPGEGLCITLRVEGGIAP